MEKKARERAPQWTKGERLEEGVREKGGKREGKRGGEKEKLMSSVRKVKEYAINGVE